MKSFTALLLTFSTLLLTINAPPPDWPVFAKLSDLKSKLRIFQIYANAAYPNKPKKQKEAIATLQYLFDNDKGWMKRDHLIPLYDYLASGGLVQHSKHMPYVPVTEAVSYLGKGTVYEKTAVVQPAMNALINLHLKKAKRAGFKAKDQLLDEVKGLSDKRPLQRGFFATVPRPFTWDEAEELKRRVDAVEASSSGGGRMHGVPWGK
ncbi:hypothetical protein NDA14_007416 [Ustilago hordei]|uniref:Uncharacterized protein n=1 Tax=Ustilago hordei TaxID=120017 RepID=I2FZT5_USTHO|nr:uncharacterized protein UHO2_03780 [Ustilago hordei]KAJ1043971.1 hypothetical protein NDA10_004512 [Ustilago hordei]KAJ1579193.1 hypothetical protein NDA15_007841 [Ustilago hordei]KAJ1580821.1 hypothetical protein NDA12_007143 [Ustilago hordei]KAJ1597422.1 hypothetical protein NDA14_007416 [Ustilago hordei]UTT92179.1 hypothetical protein NDA17_003174 [Ustilago hordei]